MWKRNMLVCLLVLLSALVIVMLLPKGNAACSFGDFPPGHPSYTETSWPVDATWTITTGTDCTGTTIYARGSIVITSTGSLNLKNSKLLFNMSKTTDGGYGITVKGGGRLDIVNSEIRVVPPPLIDYQVLVNVDTATLITAGKMKADGSDIRFTDSDGTTILSHWVEPGTINTGLTKIWVKVPYILSTVVKKIYMNYGNAGATDISSGNNTFGFFDDFDGASLDTSKWPTYIGSIFVGGGVLNLGVGTATNTYIAATGFDLRAYAKEGLGASMEGRIRATALPISANFGARSSDTFGNERIGGGYGFNMWMSRHTWHYCRQTCDGGCSYWRWFHYGGLTSWNRVGESWISGSSVTYLSQGNTASKTGYVPRVDSASPFYPYIGDRDTDYGLQVDWVFIRKYSYPEPKLTLGGEGAGTLTGWANSKPVDIDNVKPTGFDYSSPGSRAQNKYYKFVVEKNGVLNIDTSDISGMWGIDAAQITDVHGGIEIYSDLVGITDSKIHDGKIMGIYISGSSPRIEGTEIYNNGRGSEGKFQAWIYPPGWAAEMANSHASGIFIVDASPIIERVNIHHNWYWEFDGSKHRNYGDSGYYDYARAYRIYGTGIYMYNSVPYIGNSTIKYNGHDDDTWWQNYDDCGWGKCLKAEVGEGIGILGIKSSPKVFKTTITKNKVGIYINEEKPQEMEKVFPIVIEQCDIKENWDSAGWEWWRLYRGTGIYIEYAQHGLIKNNTIKYNGRPIQEARGWGDWYWSSGMGIGLRGTNVEIIGNTIQYHFRGIFGYETVRGKIAYNNILWNTHRPHEHGWWNWWAWSWWYYWTAHFKFYGQGIWLEIGCVPTIEYNVIDHNGAKYYEPNVPFRNYWESSWETHGIFCSVGSNPVVRYNQITWNGAWGVRSYDTSSPEVYNNNISWNGFKAYDHSWGEGIATGHGSTWKIMNNTIMFNGNHHAGGAWGWGWGIVGYWHSTEIIVNNTISRNWVGMRLHGCRAGTIIEKNNISYNGFTYWWYPRGVGISVYSPISWSGQFPVIRNNYIAYNGFYGGHGPSIDYWWQAGIHSYQGGAQAKIAGGNVLEGNEYAFTIWSTTVVITDTIIKDSFSSDFFLTDSSVVTLINNTHQKGRVIFGDDTSTIRAYWYLDLQLIWKATKAPVQCAGMDLYDSYERYVLTAYTDADGRTKRITLLEYETSKIKSESYNPYRFEIFVSGRSIANESLNVNRTMFATIEVGEAIPPQISIISPKMNASLSTATIKVIGSASDDESGIDVIDIAVGAGEWQRVPGYGLTTWSYTLELPGDGEYTVFAKATDRAGNYDIAWVKFVVKAAEPFFYVSFPPDNYITSNPTIRVTGIADMGLAVTINDESVTLYERSFSKYIDLYEGNNIIKVEARDIVGNVKSESRVVILDTIKPFIQVSFPPDNYETNKNIIRVEGVTEEGAELTINGESVETLRGSFSKDIVLRVGPNAINFEAIDKAENQNSTLINVKYDNVPPDLSVFTPHQNALLNRTDVRVTGTTEENALLTINDKKIDVRAGRFDTSIELIEGNNTIVVTASDTAGNKNTIIRNVYVDTAAPVLVVVEPMHGEITNKLTIQVSGTTEVGAKVYIGGSEIPVVNGTFYTNVSLLDNTLNNITVTAEDIVKNSKTVTREVKVDTMAPALTVTEPEDGFKVRKGTIIVVGVTEPDIVELEVNGKPMQWDSLTGQFTGSIEIVRGKNIITVTAKDLAGNVATVTKEGEYRVGEAEEGIFALFTILWLIIGIMFGIGIAFPIGVAISKRYLRRYEEPIETYEEEIPPEEEVYEGEEEEIPEGEEEPYEETEEREKPLREDDELDFEEEER